MPPSIRAGPCASLCNEYFVQLAGRVLLVFMFLTLLRFEMSAMQVSCRIKPYLPYLFFFSSSRSNGAKGHMSVQHLNFKTIRVFVFSFIFSKPEYGKKVNCLLVHLFPLEISSLKTSFSLAKTIYPNIQHCLKVKLGSMVGNFSI